MEQVKWQYRTYLFTVDDDFAKLMNKLGAEGWEAFHIELFEAARTKVYFKRRIE